MKGGRERGSEGGRERQERREREGEGGGGRERPMPTIKNVHQVRQTF